MSSNLEKKGSGTTFSKMYYNSKSTTISKAYDKDKYLKLDHLQIFQVYTENYF